MTLPKRPHAPHGVVRIVLIPSRGGHMKLPPSHRGRVAKNLPSRRRARPASSPSGSSNAAWKCSLSRPEPRPPILRVVNGVEDQDAPRFDARVVKASIEKSLHLARSGKRRELDPVVYVAVHENDPLAEIGEKPRDDKGKLQGVRLTPPVSPRQVVEGEGGGEMAHRLSQLLGRDGHSMGESLSLRQEPWVTKARRITVCSIRQVAEKWEFSRSGRILSPAKKRPRARRANKAEISTRGHAWSAASSA